jgi:hypothetical protein
MMASTALDQLTSEEFVLMPALLMPSTGRFCAMKSEQPSVFSGGEPIRVETE